MFFSLISVRNFVEILIDLFVGFFFFIKKMKKWSFKYFDIIEEGK